MKNKMLIVKAGSIFTVISLEVNCNSHNVGTTGDSFVQTNKQKDGIQNVSLLPDPGTQQCTFA